MVFIQVLRSVFPQFGESNNQGYMQQDAEECWSQIMQALNEKVPGLTLSGESNTSTKFVDQYMTTELTSETTCDDAPTESPSVSIDALNKIRVTIGAGASTYMTTEIGNGLVEKIEKTSPSLGRNAMYTKKSKISKLPKYLTINFIRFQWKPQDRIKAKILKRVQFPFELDMVSYCAPDLQKKLAPAKQRLKEISDKKSERKKLKLDPETAEEATSKTQAELLTELGCDASLVSDPGVNPSGQYDLVAVLTHVGRAADSGHYIGWVKQGGEWWKFDDDKVSMIKEEDISKLEGGGDWHSAYICLYKSKDLE